jgi:hypothetical protein
MQTRDATHRSCGSESNYISSCSDAGLSKCPAAIRCFDPAKLFALVLGRGDEDFRLVVDQKLSQTIRSDAFRGIYAHWFGEFDQSAERFFCDIPAGLTA